MSLGCPVEPAYRACGLLMAVAAIERPHRASLRAPAVWGLVFGGLQAASPLAFWWLDTATVYTVGLVLIASVYIGFAVADGRAGVIAVESSMVGIFVVVGVAACFAGTLPEKSAT